MNIVKPAYDLSRFNCPHCHAFSHQTWYQAKAKELIGGVLPTQTSAKLWSELENMGRESEGEEATEIESMMKALRSNQIILSGTDFGEIPQQTSWGRAVARDVYISEMYVSQCLSCQRLAFWIGKRIIWPTQHSAPVPNSDMPKDVIDDYNEAAVIASASPRGAAALLRLCIEKLCNHVLKKSQSVNSSIDELENSGLSPTIANALHIVRVIGNDSVHPGELNLKDDPETVDQLFILVNRIADALITQPKKDAELWASLPKTKRQAVEDKRAAAAKTSKNT